MESLEVVGVTDNVPEPTVLETVQVEEREGDLEAVPMVMVCVKVRLAVWVAAPIDTEDVLHSAVTVLDLDVLVGDALLSVPERDAVHLEVTEVDAVSRSEGDDDTVEFNDAVTDINDSVGLVEAVRRNTEAETDKVTVDRVASTALEIVKDLPDHEVVAVTVEDNGAETLSEAVRDHPDLVEDDELSIVTDTECKNELDTVAVKTVDAERLPENDAIVAEMVLVGRDAEKLTFRDGVTESLSSVIDRLFDSVHVS